MRSIFKDFTKPESLMALESKKGKYNKNDAMLLLNSFSGNSCTSTPSLRVYETAALPTGSIKTKSNWAIKKEVLRKIETKAPVTAMEFSTINIRFFFNVNFF